MILTTHTGLLGQERSGRLMEYLEVFFFILAVIGSIQETVM